MIRYVIQFLDDSIHDTTYDNITQIEDWANGHWAGPGIYLKIDTSQDYGTINGRVLDDDKVLAKIWALRKFGGITSNA